MSTEGVNYKRDTREPFWWGMFSAGGVVAALLVPIHILLEGLAVPLAWVDPGAVAYERMQALIASPLVKVYLFVLLVLPLYHAAHRVRFTLYELGIRGHGPVAVLCYGVALAGTAASAWILLSLP